MLFLIAAIGLPIELARARSRSSDDLAKDLQRYLDGDTVLARRKRRTGLWIAGLAVVAAVLPLAGLGEAIGHRRVSLAGLVRVDDDGVSYRSHLDGRAGRDPQQRHHHDGRADAPHAGRPDDERLKEGQVNREEYAKKGHPPNGNCRGPLEVFWPEIVQGPARQN